MPIRRSASLASMAAVTALTFAASGARANTLDYAEIYAGGSLPVGTGEYGEQAVAGYAIGARGGMYLTGGERAAFEVSGDWRPIPAIDEPEVPGETVLDGEISRFRVLAAIRYAVIATERSSVSFRASAGIERSTGSIVREVQTDEGPVLAEFTDHRLGPAVQAAIAASLRLRNDVVLGIELAAPVAYHDGDPTAVFLEDADGHVSIDLDLRLSAGYRF